MRLTYNEWRVFEDALDRGRRATEDRIGWLQGLGGDQAMHIGYEQGRLKALDTLKEKVTRADRAITPVCGHACVDHSANRTES